MPFLQEELQLVFKQSNLHKIRTSTNEHSPHGRPDIHFLPEAYNATPYLHPVGATDLIVAKDICCNVPKDEYSRTFSELAYLIITDNNLQLPGSDIDKAERLYIDLLGFIKNI